MVLPTFNSLLMRLTDKLIVPVIKAPSNIIIICSQKQLKIKLFQGELNFYWAFESPIAPKKILCIYNHSCFQALTIILIKKHYITP